MKTKLFYLLLLVCAYSYGQTFPTNNLAGYYKFDSGSILIDQAGASNLTQTGTNLLEVTDRFNTANTNAVNLNGDDLSRADVGNVNTTSTNLAVSHSFWIKTNSTASNVNEFIIGDSDRANLSFGSSDYGYDILLRNGVITLSARYAAVQSYSSGGGTPAGYTHASTETVNNNQWRHVAVVMYTTSGHYNQIPGRIYSRIYIDGSLESTHSFVAATNWGRLTSMPFSTGNLVIGNNRNQNLTSANQYKNGFDDYFVYNRVLTDAEVTTLATQDGYCFAPQSSVLSATGVTENAAIVNISTTGTYDIAYAIQGTTFNGLANFNNVGATVSLTGLNASTYYNIYIREECTAGFESDWSEPISFRTLGPIYVDDTATGLNNGSSWANAYTDLTSAMDADVDGQEIWVAGGTYKTGNIINSFTIDKANVKLYGGFAGTETLLSQRVLGANESIISGDNNGDDDPNTLYEIDFATRRDNTRRLIKLDGASDGFLIDGFTITAAMSGPNGTTSGETGAGIYNVDADNVMVSNCKFFRNGATGQGGAILAVPSNSGQMTIESCVFEENFAASGGAVYQLTLGRATTVNINKSIFLNNKTTESAGAIYSLSRVSGATSLNIDACQFIGNNSRSGGAIYAEVQDIITLNVSITNSLFNGNVAEDNATDTGFTGSAAWLRTKGGASTIIASIVNNTFVNNSDLGTSPGLTNFNRATLALSKNVTYANNTATISNNIFFHNQVANGVTTNAISSLNEFMATVTVENSIDEKNFSLIPAGSKTNTSNANPLFTSATDFTLQAGSPAIDTGNNGSVTTTSDLLGNQRIFNTTVDMGAYETNTSVQRTLTINATNGTVTTNPNPTSGTYANGTVVGLTATPASGYQFTGWSGAATGTTNPVNVTMDADKTVTANFSLITVVQRTLTINATNGSVTTNPNPTSGTYANGTVVGLTAVPASGYQFTGWSGAATGTTNPVNITMDANKTVTANFSLITVVQRTLTIPSYTGGTLTVSPSAVNGTYADGTVVTLTATPAAGYQFNFFNFPGASLGSNATNPLTVTMDGDKTILPVFTNIFRTLNLSITNNGSQNDGVVELTEGTSSTTSFTNGTFNEGTSITLNATPRTANHQFDGWSGGVTSTANPVTFSMDTDKNILANFSIIQHSLTINATNGTVTSNPNPTSGTYDQGTYVYLTAVPNAGYQFDGWSGDVTGASTSINVGMFTDKTVTATFSLISAVQRTLTINATNGTVTTNPNPTSGTYANGTVVGLTATPASGYQFTGWSGAATGTTNPVNITMDADKTVTANFSLISAVQRTLTINATNGTVTTNPNPTNGTYNNGTVVTLTATPNTGYVFTGWSGAATGTTNPLNITMDANKTITAVFTSTAIQRTLTINATNGTVTTNPNPTNGTYNNGTVVGLTATPNTGYVFTGWSGAANGSTNSVNVTMNANKTVTATFSLISATTTTTWIGNTTLWSSPGNWDNGVPTALSDAIIPSGLTIYPTASTAVTFNSLTIASGGSFIAQSTVTGNVTYNRTVTNDWHLLASPVVGQDIAAIKNDVAINGVKYAVAPYDNTQSSPLLRYNYFTTASGTNDINSAGNFEAAKGYSVKKATAGTIAFTGAVNTADVPMVITDNVTTGGNNWNLVGNPFTASLNGNNNANTTNNFLTVNANQLDPARVAVYLWDAATSSYNIMNHTTTGSKYIAPGQGFFVASKNAGGTLQFTEAMQSHQIGNIFSKTSNNIVPSIELFVSNGSSQKTTSVKYYNTATIGLDPGYDAGVFSGKAQTFNVYTQLLSNTTTVGFGIQSLPTNNYDAMVIPVGVNAVANTTLSFTIDAQNLPAGIHVYLEDKVENTFTLLDTTQANYTATVSSALNGDGRFYIHTTNSVLGVDTNITALNSISIYKSNIRTLTIIGLANQEQNNIKVYTILGKEVFNTSVTAQQKVTVQLPISLSTGMYIVKLQTANGSVNKKVFID